MPNGGHVAPTNKTRRWVKQELGTCSCCRARSHAVWPSFRIPSLCRFGAPIAHT